MTETRSNVRVWSRPEGSEDWTLVCTARNKVPDAGLELLRDLLGGTAVRPDAIALGTSSTATTDEQTALNAEVFRKEIDRRIELATGIDFQAFLSGSDASGQTLREIGLFAGTRLLARAPLSPEVVKNPGLEFTFSFVQNFARG